jgi:uncharacterized protein (TIGR00725 family)
MTKTATFFGGALNDTTTKEYQETIQIGELLSEKGFLIKNGGYRGLMEAVSKGITSKGGIAIGYTVKTFHSTQGNKYLTNTVVCETLYDRLDSLIKNSELFIIQKGSIGTLAELFLAIDIVRKYQDVNIPKFILIGNFWKSIFKELSVLITEKDMKLINIVNDFEEFKVLMNTLY